MNEPRIDGRQTTDLRPVRLTAGFIEHAEGSVLIEMGKTKVICTASIEQSVPKFLAGKGRGWVTAEYGMLPRATDTRNEREATRGKIGGRTMEIQRLIGRSLRSVVDFEALGERTVTLDCDVIQADGGTRTASITGAWVALALACRAMVSRGELLRDPVREPVAAISVGMYDGRALLDLCYHEDSRADVDMNVVMTGSEEFVEIQGTAEGRTFAKPVLDELTALASDGIRRLVAIQRQALGV